MKSFCLLCLVFLLSGLVPAHADPGSGSASPLVEREFAAFGEWRCRFTPGGVGSYCFLVDGGAPVLKVVALSPGKSGKYTIRPQIGLDDYYSSYDFLVKINNHGHEVSFRTVFDPENVDKKKPAEEKKIKSIRIIRHEDIVPFLKNISQGQSVLIEDQDTEDDNLSSRYRLDGVLKAIGALIYVARAHGLKMDLPFEPLEKSEMLMPVREMSFPPLPGKTVRHVQGQWTVAYKPVGEPTLNFIEGPVNEGYDFSEAKHTVINFRIFKGHDAGNDLRVVPWATLETDFLKDLEQPLELWFRDGHHVLLRGRIDNDGTVFVAPGFQSDALEELLAIELLSSVPVAFVRGDRALMLDAAEDRGMLDLFRADINPDTSKNYYLGTIVHTQ